MNMLFDPSMMDAPEAHESFTSWPMWPFQGLERQGYDLIMADPNWRFDTWTGAGKNAKSPERHYKTDSIEKIAALPVRKLAHRNCLLWLWATHPMIDQQIWVLRQWGFRFVTSGVWVKRTSTGKLTFGTGYRLRSASEPFLIGTIGFPVTARDVRTVVEGLVRQHSEKPDEAYDAAERLLPRTLWGCARRADLYSRRDRSGWHAWGDQAGALNERRRLPGTPAVPRSVLRDRKNPELAL